MTTKTTETTEAQTNPEEKNVTPPAPGALARREERRNFLAKVVPPEHMESLARVHDQFFGALAAPDLSVPERTLLTAVATTQLREALKPMVRPVLMPLMNTPIGFDTDKNPAKGWSGQSYDEATVLECTTQAWLHGLPPTGNAFNIIAGGMYPRKEGYEGLLSTVCRFSATATVPAISDNLYQQGGYLNVPVLVQYRLHSEPEDAPARKFHQTYSVRLNKRNAVGVESCEGKAKRKAYRDLWHALSGVLLADADDPDGTASVHQVGAHFGSPDTPSAADLAAGAGKTERVQPEEPELTEEEQAFEAAQEEASADPSRAEESGGGLFGGRR